MSRAKATMLVALLAATFGFAQNNPGNGTPGQSKASRADQNSVANQPVNVEGCLSSSAMGDNAFTLTQDQTGKVYRLTGDVSQLTSHVGHEVVLSGVRSGEQTNSNSAAGSGLQSSTLQVSGIRMVSDHCASSPARDDQGAGRAATSDPAHKPQTDNNLPQTATILPLLGLVGLSSLVTGFIFRNR